MASLSIITRHLEGIKVSYRYKGKYGNREIALCKHIVYVLTLFFKKMQKAYKKFIKLKSTMANKKNVLKEGIKNLTALSFLYGTIAGLLMALIIVTASSLFNNNIMIMLAIIIVVFIILDWFLKRSTMIINKKIDELLKEIEDFNISNLF